MNMQKIMLSTALLTIFLGGCSQETENTADSTSDSATSNQQQETATTEPVTPAAPVSETIAKPNTPPGVITQAVIEYNIQTSRAGIKAFAGALQSELQAAMKDGGPVNAISVCNLKAPEITAQVSADKEMKLSRVSLKNRNSNNAPLGWPEGVLRKFEERLQNGEAAGEIEHHEVVEINGENQFRFMKAIPTGKICLACHGSELADPVKAKLQELYPADKATGFKEGDLRGAFVVTRSL